MNRSDHIQEIIENSSRLKRMALSDRSVLGDLQLSRAQLELIHLLYVHESIGSKKAANLLGVSTSAVSQLADSLLAEDYISRTPDPKDRRLVYMSLTAKGRRAIKKLRKTLTSGFRAALESLSDDELKTLSRIYKKLADAAGGQEENKA